MLHGKDAVLDESLTCIHCRFYKDHLQKYQGHLHNIPTASSIDCQVKRVTANCQQSCSSYGDCNFYQTNSCFANCQKGECNARLMNKKKIPKSISIQQSHSWCGHIQTLFANFEIMKELFPDYFGSSCNTTEDSNDTSYDLTFASTCDINTQDEFIDETTHEDSEHFNTITGMWEFG